MSLTTNPQAHGAARRARAFTLVELLVVIVIIGILIGLLIPVIGLVRASTQEAAITTEVTNIGQALQSFATQFSAEFPPDFTGGNQQAEINVYLSRLFRYRNPATDVPRSAAGIRAEQLAMLDPSEALYFWLRGFTSDPANPLFGPLDQDPRVTEEDRTPIYEFDRTRLRDSDGDGFLEYYPRFATARPYVYYVHYNYVRTFATPDAALLVARGPVGSAAFTAPRPYLSTQESPTPDPTFKSSYAAPSRFQILCAGLDNDFGLQVPNSPPEAFLPYAFPTGPYPDKAHRDNITNFAAGTLEDSLP